jgi:hypothetical protein
MYYEILNEAGEVTNTIVASLEFVEAHYAGRYREISGSIPAPQKSQSVTPFQAKAALLDAGLLDDIEALIADPATDRKVVLAWNNAITFERLSPMVAGIAVALGWTDEELDDLFAAAAQIT